MKLPFEDLNPTELLRHSWLCSGVALSGLAPYDKLLLLLLLQLDPLARGIVLPWRELAARTKLSLSSCHRAAERLELLQLVAIQRQFTELQEPSANLFVHLLQRGENLWFRSSNPTLFQAEFLDAFLAMRAGFEEALKIHIEKLHLGKGSKWKKQGRASSHSPRPWRQTFGPLNEQGGALQAVSRYRIKGKAEASKEHVRALVEICLRQMFPQATEEQILQVTPKDCLDWLQRPR